MKEKFTYLEIDENNKVPMCFNLNVLEEIQEKYGSLQKWGDVVENKEDGVPQIKDLKAGLMAMINEAIDIENEKNGENKPPLTSKQVGRVIGQIGMNKLVEKIKEMTVESTRVDSESKNE